MADLSNVIELGSPSIFNVFSIRTSLPCLFGLKLETGHSKTGICDCHHTPNVSFLGNSFFSPNFVMFPEMLPKSPIPWHPFWNLKLPFNMLSAE